MSEISKQDENARIEEGFRQYTLFTETLRTLAEQGREAGGEEVTLDIDGFCLVTAHFCQLLDDCKRLYAERNSTLSSGQDTRRLDAEAVQALDNWFDCWQGASVTRPVTFGPLVVSDGMGHTFEADRFSGLLAAFVARYEQPEPADAIIVAQPGEESGS